MPGLRGARKEAMYLVTGGTGFVGRALLQALCPRAAERNERVYALCRDAAAFAAEPWVEALPALEPIQGELRDVARLADALPPLHTVFHLAAVVHHSRRDHATATRTNVEGTQNIVALGRRLGARTVFVSTSGTVGCSDDPAAAPDEHAPFCERQVARWPYYASKIAAERAARALVPEAAGLVILRPPVILGPGDGRFRATGNVVRLLRGRLPFSLPGGMHFVDVREVVSALLAAAEHPEPQPVYHLPGHASGLQAFFVALARVAGVRPPRFVLPKAAGLALARLDAGLGRLWRGAPLHLFVDEVVVEMGCSFWGLTSRYAARDLRHAPRPAEETLRDTVAFVRAHRTDCG